MIHRPGQLKKFAQLRWNIDCGSPEKETWSDVGEYLVTCDRREEWAVIRTSQRQQPQPGYYSSFSRSEDQWFVILRNREGQITEIIVTDRFENLAPPASKEYHHPQHCFQFSELIDSLIALTSLDPSQLAIIYLQRVRVRPSFQSRDQGKFILMRRCCCELDPFTNLFVNSYTRTCTAGTRYTIYTYSGTVNVNA